MDLFRYFYIDKDVLRLTNDVEEQLKGLTENHKAIFVESPLRIYIDLISSVIITNDRLQLLDFIGCKLHYDQVKSLCCALQSNTSIHSLYFTQNRLSSGSIAEITKTFKASQKLDTLVLKWNLLNTEDINCIIDLLKSKSKLKSLSLVCTGDAIWVAFGMLITAVIQSNLFEFSFAGHRNCSSSDWLELAKYIENPKCRLQKLDISDNGDDLPLPDLLSAIAKNKSLRILEVSLSLAETNWIPDLANILQTNSTLEMIDIRKGTSLHSRTFISAASKALRNNFTLSQLLWVSGETKLKYKLAIQNIIEMNINWSQNKKNVDDSLLIKRYCYQMGLKYISQNSGMGKRRFTLWLITLFKHCIKLPYDVIFLILGKNQFWLNGGTKIGAFEWEKQHRKVGTTNPFINQIMMKNLK